MRGIRDEYLSLVSVSDSEEVARVSAECAREHLQLAYASTVHGVKGDTADVSMAGPGVDAAGLYVGLTRGRVHNVAIVVARTDAAARHCLAEAMQRGTRELTIQDAVRAAEAEGRRAARSRDAAIATGPVVELPASASTVRAMGIQRCSIEGARMAYPGAMSAMLARLTEFPRWLLAGTVDSAAVLADCGAPAQ